MICERKLNLYIFLNFDLIVGLDFTEIHEVFVIRHSKTLFFLYRERIDRNTDKKRAFVYSVILLCGRLDQVLDRDNYRKNEKGRS
jgi:hypothetical protein